MNYYKLLIIILLFCGHQLTAQKPDHAAEFENGLRAYKKSEFDQAVKHYELSLSGTLKSAQAYNNLGLAYYKMGDLGRAILNFERALRLQPAYSPAIKNLRAARQYIDSNVKKHNGFWLFGLWESMATMMTSFAWALIFYILLFVASTGLLLWYLKLDERLSFVGIRTGIVLLPFSILAFGLGAKAASVQFDNNYAIVTGVKAGVRSAPGLDGEDIMVLSSGVKAIIKEHLGDWYKVRLENGVLGWVPCKAVEKI